MRKLAAVYNRVLPTPRWGFTPRTKASNRNGDTSTPVGARFPKHMRSVTKCEAYKHISRSIFRRVLINCVWAQLHGSRLKLLKDQFSQREKDEIREIQWRDVLGGKNVQLEERIWKKWFMSKWSAVAFYTLGFYKAALSSRLEKFKRSLRARNSWTGRVEGKCCVFHQYYTLGLCRVFFCSCFGNWR